MTTRANRSSNIELLRIIAACGVIILHYNCAQLGGGYNMVADRSINQSILTLAEVLFICAVNVYILITGYFMRDSMKRNLIKPLGLLAELFIIETAFYIVKELLRGNVFSFKTFISYYTPNYWFVLVFIALYMVSPYINLVWRSLDSKSKTMLLTICIGLFSVYPIIQDIIQYYYGDTIYGSSVISLHGSSSGYTIVNFVLMYLIGCYLRDMEESGIRFRNSTLIPMFILNILLLFCLTNLEHVISGKHITQTVAWNYDNPLVILSAVLIFLIFKNIRIENNEVINLFAAASFSTYLIHINLLEYFNISGFINNNPILLVLHILFCAVLIYLISFAIHLIYDAATKPLFSYMNRRWKEKCTYTVAYKE